MVSIAANSRWNLFGFGCTLAAHIITVPLVIGQIGLPAFGHAGLVLAVWVPLFVGTVLSSSVVRLVSSSDAASTPQTILHTLNNALLVCGIACAIIGVLVVLLMPWLFSSFVADSRPTAAWRIDFSIAAVAWVTQQYSLVLQGVMVGERKFRTVALVNFAVAAITVISILALVRVFPDSTGYLAGIALGFCSSVLIWSWVVGVSHGRAALRHVHHRENMRPLAVFGKWQAISLLAGNFANQIDRYVLGLIAPARVIGQFNAAYRMQEAVYALVMKGAEVLFPHFGANASRSRDIQLDFFLRANWVTITFGSIVLVPAIVLAFPLLSLWAGSEVANGGSILLKTLVLGGLIGCASNVATYYFLGVGLAERVTRLSIWYSGVTVASSVALLYAFGPSVAGLGIVIASVVRVWMSLSLARKDFGAELSASKLFAANILPLLVGIGIAAALEFTPIDGLSHWYSVIAAYMAVSALIAVVSAACISLHASGRSWLREVAGAFLPRKVSE